MGGRILTTDYPSWLHAYRDWTVPRSEAPESFILWAGLYTLSSVLKRHVCVPAKLMGSYEIYPNLYVVFVGPPGGPRKSTTIGYAKTLLRPIEHVTIASTAVSASKLINIMEETVDGAISITSSEFGSFVNVSQEEMYDFLTDAWDNPPQYEYSTRLHGTEVVHKPTINLIAGTTPSWINEHMPPYVLGGGFSSRCVFIYETAPRRRRMYYDDVDSKDFERLEEALVHDLSHIAQLEGEFRHESEDLKKDMEDWYRQHARQIASHEKIEGYMSRKHVFVHKLAMLLSVAEDDRLVLSESHFEIAKELLGGVEEQMPRVFQSVGRNPYSAELMKVRDYIEKKGAASFEQLLARFYHDIDADEMRKILQSLELMDYVKEVQNPRDRKPGTWYFPPDGE